MLNHIEEKPQKQAHLGRRAHKFTGPFRLSLQETGMKPQLVMHPMVTLLVLWPCSRGVGRGRREAGRGEGRGRGGGKWGPLKPTLRGIHRSTTKPLETHRCTTPPSSLGLPLEGHSLPLPSRGSWTYPVGGRTRERAHPDLNQGPADLQSAALTTELCTQVQDARYLQLPSTVFGSILKRCSNLQAGREPPRRRQGAKQPSVWRSRIECISVSEQANRKLQHVAPLPWQQQQPCSKTVRSFCKVRSR